MNFLDENGLGRLWAQIILKLNSKVPDGGTTGQVLKKTETGTEWADAPQTVTIPETTALLKGDGVGGVAAVTTDTTPTQGSTNPVTSGGVYTALADKLDKTGDGSNVTAAFTAATARTNIATGEKLSVLFGKIAKWFSDLGSLAFKSTVAKTDLASDVQTSLGKADSALQSVTKSDVGLGNVDNVKQYSASNPPPYPVTSVNGQTGDVEVQSGSQAASYTATLTTSGWAQSGSGYSQTVNVTGVTASSNGSLRIAQSATDKQFAAWGKAQPRVTAQAAGTLTVKAAGTVPAIDIPVEVLIV